MKINCGFTGILLIFVLINHSAGIGPESPNGEHSFGLRQIDQMLEDRPEMAGILGSQDPVYLWVAAAFSGERIGNRIYWNASCPEDVFAVNRGSAGGYPAYISVTNSSGFTAIDKWVMVIFELHNIENYEDYELLTTKARAETIDMKSFATACTKLEFLAELKTNEFLNKHRLPNVPGLDRYYDWFSRKDPKQSDYIRQSGTPRMHSERYDNFEYFRTAFEEITGNAAMGTSGREKGSGAILVD